MLKSFKRPFIIVPVISFILIIAFYYGIHIWFENTSRWEYNVENFEIYRKDFEIVAEFCRDYIRRDDRLEREHVLFVYDNKKKELLCNWENINFPEEVGKSFESIKIAFPNKDAQFDSITCYEGNVYFETHNGLYSVVLSTKGVPGYLDGVNKGTSRKIDDNWYHVVKSK